MNLKKFIAAILVAGFASSIATASYAQEKTRAEVRQELIDAQNHGLNLVTDTSYPEVSPIYQQQAAALNAAHQDGYGAAASGTSSMGQKDTRQVHGDTCVGPVSFCSIFFGS